MAEDTAVRKEMPVARAVVKGQALILGGLAAGVVLCACLSLIAFAFLFVAFVYLDRDRAGGPDWTIPATFLSVTLTASLIAASRFGWKVGQDWYRNGH
jgi:hypothetical protein